MKRGRAAADPRIKAKHMSWVEYSLTFFVLSVLSAGQVMILMAYIGETYMPMGFIFGMIGYWAIVAFVFNLITNDQIKRKFENPMRRLGDAANKVAKGDFSVYVKPVHTEDKYDYVDVMFNDFNVMVEKLGRIEILQRDFIANISHEIRAPLAVIKSYATQLQKEDIDAQTRKEYTETIVSATDRLAQLVTNVLKLSRIENAQEDQAAEAYDLCGQLVEAVLRYEAALDAKQIALCVDIEERAIVQADKAMMGVIWDNLLSNAIKFTDQGGGIALTQRTEGASILVSIADTGCGMHKDVMEHIFDKFYQGDVSHSGAGSGLGLTLAVKALERVGGTISVTSTLGKGSTFSVQAPIVRQNTLSTKNGTA